MFLSLSTGGYHTPMSYNRSSLAQQKSSNLYAAKIQFSGNLGTSLTLEALEQLEYDGTHLSFDPSPEAQQFKQEHGFTGTSYILAGSRPADREGRFYQVQLDNGSEKVVVPVRYLDKPSRVLADRSLAERSSDNQQP